MPETQLQSSAPVLHRSQFYPGLVEQRAIAGLIIFTGVEADLPSGQSHVKAYFATDTNKLFLYNGGEWVGVQLL